VQPEPSPPGASTPFPEPVDHTIDPRRFVVCGANPMAFRLVEELATRYDSRVTSILPPDPDPWGARIRQLAGIDVVESERVDLDAFQRAGLAGAAAVGLIDQDDGGNVDAALLAQEVNPDLRIVMRMFNIGLGERIAELLNDCVVLSAAEIAAPAFVAAALDESSTPPMTIGDRTFIATRRDQARAEDIVIGLAVSHSGPVDPELLPAPASEDLTDVVLTRTSPAPLPGPPRRRHQVSAMAVLLGARIRLVIGILLAVFVAGTGALMLAKESLAQAAYTTVLSELTGANADPGAAPVEKVTLTFLTIVSIALIPALTAAVVDSAVKARLRSERGGVRPGIANHVVVVGLGHVGTRVIRDLTNRGAEVVAIERDTSALGIEVARELGIPVIIGEAGRSEVLDAASVATCRAFVVVSTDDVTNLEISLLGRAAQPNLRVVLRLFDGDFARRVQRAFAINISRSVSSLAAPAFAAAMLGRDVVATIPVRRRVLIVAELPVRAGSRLEQHPVAEVNRTHEVRLLAIRTGRDHQMLWFPSAGRRLVRTDSLVVVATRDGFGRLVADTHTPRTSPAPAADRLLVPWETPHQRPTGAARHAGEPTTDPTTDAAPRPAGDHATPGRGGVDAVDNQPGGPADNDSTRTA
jgi:Trk K+ transport system NAD-binding subunit